VTGLQTKDIGGSRLWFLALAAAMGGFLFIFSHAVGQGTVIWVFVSDVVDLPLEEIRV